MFSVRELAELVRRIDEAAFCRQMGPFALVQRPRPEALVEEGRADTATRTTKHPALRLHGAPTTVDFGDLRVAALPPPGPDGAMELTFGRAPDCDVVLHDTAASKLHAAVHWDGAVAVLEERGSANGTFVNGHRMKDRWTLRDADQVVMGESHFVFLWSPTLYRRLRGMSR